jgi:hypothetical protein
MRDRFCVMEECSNIQLVQIVQRAVINSIMPLSRLTTENHGFFFVLDALGTGEKATGRNSDFEEWTVVRAPLEFGGGKR